MKSVPFLVGPTGAGKTEISIHLAKSIPIEIISADSRQIYQLLDIGTAKPSSEILKKIPHHFIDYLSPNEYFSAGMYGREARKKIKQVQKNKKIPLVVGGSGFYIQALIDGLSEIDAYDQTVRDDLRERLDKEGAQVLHRELESVDPDLAVKIKINDWQRILRGLEVYYVMETPLSKLQLSKPNPADFKPVLIGLEVEREYLYKKINHRVDEMIEIGLVDEVRQLKGKGFSEKDNALNSVGYKEVFDYLNNTIEYDEMVEKIKINSRRYAKRQMTWFRRDKRITWLKIDENMHIDNIVNESLEIFKKYQHL